MIPARIFQTWKSKTEFPANFAQWSATFKQHNPAFEHELWDDADNRNFIRTRFPWFLPTYDAYPAEIYRADAVRYFYLYCFGGIYADMDVECLKPLDDLLPLGGVVLGQMGPDPDFPHSLPNAIMASAPRQRLWLLALGLLPYFAQVQRKVEFTAGPVFLKSVVDLYRANDPLWADSVIASVAQILNLDLQPSEERTNITILPSRRWYAVDWTDPIHLRLREDVLAGKPLDAATKAWLFKDAWMVTYWTHTW